MSPFETRYYCIMHILGGGVLYAGTNAADAAIQWVAGTCHGQGRSKFEAIENAKKVAEQLRK